MKAQQARVDTRAKGGIGDLRRTVRLFRRFMGSPRVYVLGIVLLVFEAATAIIEPYPIAYLIDFLQGVAPSLSDQFGLPTILPSEQLGTVLVLTIAVIAIAAINSAADSLTEVCMARGGRSLGYSIRVAMYSHLQRLPLAYHDRRRTGDVLTRVTGDVLVVEDFVVQSVSNILKSLLVLLGSFALLFYQSWNVALVALIVVPVLAVVSNYFSGRIKTASKTQRAREGELASTTQEMLTSIRLVQSYGRGTVDLARFADQTAKSMRASFSAANIQAQFSFVVAIAEALAICAVIWLGVWLVGAEAITVGTLVLFVLLLRNMFKPARKIVSEWYKVGKVFASVERIDDLLDREVGVTDLPGAVAAPPLRGELTFQQVSFAYPDEQVDASHGPARPLVLDRVSFEAAPGEVVALIGPSGAGKSTIAQLIPRLYDPDDGEVLVDGRSVRTLTLASLRSQVSLVLQETMLLSGSVAENIGYGVPNATAAEIEAAARHANAHDFIAALPDEYATQLGERGATLSGGQRQRIAIARAFIRHAPILILDEPTTGLDAESARIVVAALRSLMRGKTTIVISHDPTLIRSADRVLTVAEGRVIEPDRPAAIAGASRDEGELPQTRPWEPAATSVGGNGHSMRPSQTRRIGAESGLVDRVGTKLRGLHSALDPEAMTDRIDHLMLRGGLNVAKVGIHDIWLRSARCATLRYQLEMSDGSDRVVLGRLLGDSAQAERFADRVGAMADTDSGLAGSMDGWQRPVALVKDAQLVLHAFPLDPSLPTLPRAMDPGVIGPLARKHAGVDGEPAVELVHYPRDGACVLRYDFPPRLGGTSSVFGKVYGRRPARGLERSMTDLAREPDGSPVVAFPAPIHYAPSLRLLMTWAMPGDRLLEHMRTFLALDTAKRSRSRETLLFADVEACGRALACLHQKERGTADAQPAIAEIERLGAHLRVVASAAPGNESGLRRRIHRLAAERPFTTEMVLSHGDFTPSQVLIEDGKVAIVDLDGLCWADPAHDLGRFLAQVELVVFKVDGEQGRELAGELGAAFLRGYLAMRATATPVTPDPVRVSWYKRASLLRSALHASRQLKDERMRVAISLFDAAQHAKHGVER